MKLLILLCLSIIPIISQYRVVQKEIASTYIKLSLQYTGIHDYYVKPKSIISKNLIFHLKALSFKDFTFKIYDANKTKFQLPQGGTFPEDKYANFSFPLSSASYVVQFKENHFSFSITRKVDGAIIFDSSTIQLEFSEYYLQIGTILDSKTFFGFSERFTPHFKVKSGMWTIFNRDRGQRVDNGNGLQTHGYYPAYLLRQNSGNYHFSYMRSTNAMDVEVQSFTQTQSSAIYRVIGGIIDFRFVVVDKDPEEAINHFTILVTGPSAIPPFWALGFHQCRWGYKDINAVQKVLQNYQKNGIPLDTIWTDIDYMHEFQTFTVDQQKFPLDRLRAILKNYQYIPIVEPSIRSKSGYAYDEGKKRNIFIKDANGDDQVGKVWAGEVVFPDFFHPNATQYWKDMLQYLYNQIAFSGVWLDMNQISNLCNGPCSPPKGESKIDYTNDIPYHPGADKIETQAIPFNATHYGNISEANTHALFGFMQTYVTNQFLQQKARPFIITRSTTFGSNLYGFHWTGDNYANFTFLRLSISSNFMFNLWGIQMVGSDICGFGGNTTSQLCARWFQLGALYPFSRNHNEFNAIDQQPYALGPVVLECSKKNLKFRYSILKSYYREFINGQGHEPIFKPLFFEFPEDENLLNDDILETQFMIGSFLMSAPLLEQGKITRSVYFPNSTNWYNFHTGQFYRNGTTSQIQNKLTDLVPVFLREGALTFTQFVDGVTKTRELVSFFTLIAALKPSASDENSTHTFYKATGGILSIKDYNNQTLISGCLYFGCDYKISATLSMNKSSKYKILTLVIAFDAPKNLMEPITIENYVLYLEDQIIRFVTFGEIVIDGPATINIPIVQQVFIPKKQPK